jgi:hypothetical protein
LDRASDYGSEGFWFNSRRVRQQYQALTSVLKTDVLSVAKLRLNDFEKSQRQTAKRQTEAKQGRMVFGEAIRTIETAT